MYSTAFCGVEHRLSIFPPLEATVLGTSEVTKWDGTSLKRLAPLQDGLLTSNETLLAIGDDFVDRVISLRKGLYKKSGD